jgi:hypothetical protein
MPDRASFSSGTTLSCSFGTVSTATTLTTSATPMATTSRVSGAWNWLVSTLAPTMGRTISRSAACTMVSDTSSTAPEATACTRGTPMRCRKRRFIPIRPAELGTVRLMNLIAD